MQPSQITTQPESRRLRVVAALVLATLVLLLGACGNLPPSAGPASVDRAERLLQQGEAAAAAEMFERLASNNPPPDSTEFSLRAVRAWISANRADDAQRVYSAIATPAAGPLATDYQLLGVEVLLARGQTAEAWRLASQLPRPADQPGQLRTYSLQRRVALAAGRPVEGVQAGIAAERVAANDAERAAARRDLLVQLRQAADRGVRLDPAASRDTLVRGWLELGQISANAARTPLSAAGDIQRWRTRYPGHPGSTIPLPDILGPGGVEQISSAAGTRLAVLLPLTGATAAQAGAVRDGLMAALNQLPETQRPVVDVIDTGTLSVENAIAQAQLQGASFIVGPLTRNEVAIAAQSNVRGTPMLLLNFLPNEQAGGPQVWQFALSPEDEARQVARRALAFGQRNAIVFAPTGDWGNRVVAAFRDEITRGGGSVIHQASYDPSRNEFSGAVTSALKIDESRARHRRIEEITGTRLNFEPRRRSDVQMILAAGYDPLAVRQIRPMLRFFFAGAVPTYMNSENYEGDTSANRDLEGVIFPDMPWMLETSGPVAEIRNQTQPLWSPRGTRLSRLFAFGYDAGQLVLALGNRQARWPLHGVTGTLRPDGERRIVRQLEHWGQFRGGQVQAVPPRP